MAQGEVLPCGRGRGCLGQGHIQGCDAKIISGHKAQMHRKAQPSARTSMAVGRPGLWGVGEQHRCWKHTEPAMLQP
jgi:hypothetical protein